MRVAEADEYLCERLVTIPSVGNRVYPVVQGGDELEFPAIVYRAIGGRFIASLRSYKQREIDYYVTIHATSHEDIGVASDELIRALSDEGKPSIPDLSGPLDGFEVAEGLDGSIGGYYTRQYFVTLRI